MEDLSLHILDIVENSIRAKASIIEIEIAIDKKKDKITIKIIDNGIGMTESEIKNATDPFFTGKKNGKVGLGIPLLKESAREADGDLNIESKPGKGTIIKVWFKKSHIDRRPFGNVAETIITLIAGNPNLNILYTLKTNGKIFRFSTVEIKEKLHDVPINSIEVLNFIKKELSKYEKFLQQE